MLTWAGNQQTKNNFLPIWGERKKKKRKKNGGRERERDREGEKKEERSRHSKKIIIRASFSCNCLCYTLRKLMNQIQVIVWQSMIIRGLLLLLRGVHSHFGSGDKMLLPFPALVWSHRVREKMLLIYVSLHLELRGCVSWERSPMQAESTT